MRTTQAFSSLNGGNDICESPVFILTASRSGSTLLRFILDSHPELACPPETSIASACADLARTWDILESAGSGNGRLVHETPPLPPHAALAVREAIDRVYGRYLLRRGKRRWCDKSLDSFQFADLITEVYPQAKFICLYRHCMDVIASGVEACPWGLHRFGFDPFAAQYPGNNVAAIGGYWLSVAQLTLAFADKYPESCHRVRYEDLVTAPEETAAEIFTFLGAEQAPGITEECFRTPHEGEGPGDEKIWFTAGVLPGSLGRGVGVPAAALMPQLREAINEVLARLGYRQVGDQWNAALDRVDPRAYAPGPLGPPNGTDPDETDAGLAAMVRLLRERLHDRESMLDEINAHWPAVAGSTVALIVRSPGGAREELRVRLSARRIPSSRAGTADGTAATADADGADIVTADAGGIGGAPEPVATITGSTDTWESLLNGGANFVTEITSGRIRCVNRRDDYRIRSDEVHAVATLLGIARIPRALKSGADTSAGR
jgi:hypothetical protein